MNLVRICLVLVLIVSVLPAQEAKPAHSAPKEATRRVALPGNENLNYLVSARSWTLRDDEGQEKGSVFHSYYRLEGQEVEKRPIAFVFNGGPGSSSVWLHLGGLGPKRVEMTAAGEPLAPPGRLIDNPMTWLGFSDLVFIDPVGTGFSRPAKGVKGSEFYGLEEDARWVGEFIRLFCVKEKRWASPKFLVGESYGTTRAAALAQHLQDEHDMWLNGVVLVSPILNFATARFDAGHDLPYACFLPTYAAIAHHHGRAGAGKSLEAFVAEARDFALGAYWLALAEGDELDEDGRKATATMLESFTGIDAAIFLAANLRLGQNRFRRELLRDQRMSVGRMDGRLVGPEKDGIGASPETDHSLNAITGPYATAIKDYFSRELGYVEERPYRILTGKVQPWSYRRFENRYVNVAERLRRAMQTNRHLRVLACCGYQDLATPFFAMEYTVSHMGLEATGRERLEFAYYPAGHMMYIHEPSLQRLHDDVERFFAESLPQD